MAKFAPVAPIQVLEGLYNYSPETFGSYHLLLAHHTVDMAEVFANFFKRIESDKHFSHDNPLTIIMDNSIVELGDAVGPEMLAHAVSIIEDNCEYARVIPVLPDVMGNGSETRTAIQEAYDSWTRLIGGHGFMAVVQGDSMSDYQETLEFVCGEEYPEIIWLGVPRILTAPNFIGSRVEAAMLALDKGKSIHLLGFSDNIEDDFVAAGIPGIDGIDSAVPLRIKDVFNTHVITGQRDPNWFNDATVNPLMIQNLNEVRRYIEEAA